MLSIIVWSANISKICQPRQSWTGTLGIAWKRVAKITLTLDSEKVFQNPSANSWGWKILHIWTTIPKYRENRYCHLTMDERGLLRNHVSSFIMYLSRIEGQVSPPDLANLEMYVSYPFVSIQGERGVWKEGRGSSSSAQVNQMAKVTKGMTHRLHTSHRELCLGTWDMDESSASSS